MILIADDSTFMRTHIKQTLQKQGFTEFVEAENGKQAVLLYRFAKPKLVFLDITMPILDGLTALEEIKKIDAKANVIICSALATKENMEKANILGAVGFINKPFFDSIPEIINRIVVENKVGPEAFLD